MPAYPVVAAFVALFGLCIGLGGYIAKSVIARVNRLEEKEEKSLTDATSLGGRMLIVEGKVWVLEGGTRVRLGGGDDMPPS